MGISNARFAEIVGGMAPIAPRPPRQPLPTGPYFQSPCDNPQERLMRYHTPLCMCGYLMGEHSAKPTGAKERKCIDCPGLSSPTCCKRGAL